MQIEDAIFDEITLTTLDPHELPQREFLLALLERPELPWRDLVGAAALLLAHADPAAPAALRRAADANASFANSPDPHLLYNLGLCEATLGHFEEAIDAFDKAAPLFGVDAHGRLLAVVNRAACCLELRDDAGAAQSLGVYLSDLEKGRHALPADVDRSLLSLCYAFAASASHNLGHLQVAEDYYVSTLAVADPADVAALATMHQNLGAVLNQQGKFEEALLVHEKAISLHSASRCDAGHADALDNYAFAAVQQNLLPEALHAWQTALGLWQALGRREKMAALHEKLGTLHLYREHLPESVAAFQEAVTLAHELGLDELREVAQEKLDNVWTFVLASEGGDASPPTDTHAPLMLPPLKNVTFRLSSDSSVIARGGRDDAPALDDGHAAATDSSSSSSSDSSSEDDEKSASSSGLPPPFARRASSRACVVQ